MSFDQFRPKHPLRDSRSQNRQLVRLVVLLGLMLLAVYWASQGRHWEWLIPPQNTKSDLNELHLKPHSPAPSQNSK